MNGFGTIPLVALRPYFIRRTDKGWEHVETIAEAEGIEFLCPKCYHANRDSSVGTHIVVCWAPNVPDTVDPRPGRWVLSGTGFSTLTLKGAPGKSASIALQGGCNAHFFVDAGNVRDA